MRGYLVGLHRIKRVKIACVAAGRHPQTLQEKLPWKDFYPVKLTRGGIATHQDEGIENAFLCQRLQAAKVTLRHLCRRFHLYRQLIAYREVHLVLMNGTPVAKLATVATTGKIGAQLHDDEVLERATIEIRLHGQLIDTRQRVGDSRVKPVKVCSGDSFALRRLAPRMTFAEGEAQAAKCEQTP